MNHFIFFPSRAIMVGSTNGIFTETDLEQCWMLTISERWECSLMKQSNDMIYKFNNEYKLYDIRFYLLV